MPKNTPNNMPKPKKKDNNLKNLKTKSNFINITNSRKLSQLSKKASRKGTRKNISEKIYENISEKKNNLSKDKEKKEKRWKDTFGEDKQSKKSQKFQKKGDNNFELGDFDDLSNISIFVGRGTTTSTPATETGTQEIEEILNVPSRNTRVQSRGIEYLPSRTQSRTKDAEKIEDQVRYQTSLSSSSSSSSSPSAAYSARDSEFYSSTSSSSREEYSSTLSDYDNKSSYSDAFSRTVTERILSEDELFQDRPRTFDFNSDFQGKSKIEKHYEARTRGERTLTVDEALGLETPFQELSRPEESRKYRVKKIMR